MLLAACQQREPADPGANEAVSVPLPPVAPAEPRAAATAPAPPPSEAPTSDPASAGSAARPDEASAADVRVSDAGIIPAGFRGRWAESAARCGRPHERELTVAARRLAFWESEGTVTRVRPAGTRGIDVDAAFTGEGAEWTRVHRLSLDESGTRLTVSGAGSALTRVRCG